MGGVQRRAWRTVLRGDWRRRGEGREQAFVGVPVRGSGRGEWCVTFRSMCGERELIASRASAVQDAAPASFGDVH